MLLAGGFDQILHEFLIDRNDSVVADRNSVNVRS